MSTRITMPSEEQLSPGPLRELISGLHRLYLDAGAPSSRQVSTAIEADSGARGGPSHETVSAILRRPVQVPRWENVQSMVRTLAAWSHRRPDIDAEVSRFHQLWQAAELAPAAGEGDTGAPWHTDPGDYIRPLPKAMAALTEPHSFVALLEQMENEGQDGLLAPLAAALWRQPHSAKYCVEVMDEFHSKGRPKLAHTVMIAGALCDQFQELSAELRALERREADQVLETAHRYMPLQRVWEYARTLASAPKKPDGAALARPLFEDMTRHRDPSEIVNLLASTEVQTATAGQEQLADTLLSAIATTYDEEQLLELTDHMRDAGLAEETSRLWRGIAEERTPLAPVLRAMRDNERTWEATAVLRRLFCQLLVSRFQDDVARRTARMSAVLDELPKAGLYEETETLLQLIADHYRSAEHPDGLYRNLLAPYRL
ncbi:hypothetical protein [Streptomyces clavifer]|uniref:hypothetical protein n=1 Tax=Streptomyces clavifer TaxID=68188 RepID=UPI00380F24CC